MAMKQVLHVGCGDYARDKLHPAFQTPGWRELRLDIDESVQPDIVASITDIAPVADGQVDAVFSSHNLEHLYPHEVRIALKEFHRVLKPTGVALVTMPDLQEVSRLIATGGLAETAYLSSLGPITPLDILFGFRPALAAGNLFMAHHTGFTGRTLMAELSNAGFAAVSVQRVPSSFSLWAIAFPTIPTEQVLLETQNRMFPLHTALRQPEDALA